MASPAPALAAPRRALLDLDTDLAEAVAPEQRAYARRALMVPVLSLERGPWDATALAAPGSTAFAVMFVSGLAIREVLMGPSPASELLGAGDIVETTVPPDRMLPASVRFYVAEPAVAAVLDERILVAIRSWPALGGILIARLTRQDGRQAVHRAIAQLPHVEQRVVALMWHLAERWGHMTAGGVTVPLALTHDTIGRLVGSRRPTVSLALKQLAATGTLTRRVDGAWLLDGASAAALAPDAGEPRRRPDVALVHDAADPPRPPSAPRTGVAFELLRERVLSLEALYAVRSEQTLRVLELSRATREAIVRARTDRSAALSSPR